MTIDNNGVETIDPNAPEGQTGVKDNNQIAPTDYQVELEKMQAERDNYKEGLLNAKKKLKDKYGDSDEDDIDARINRAVDEKLKGIEERLLETSKAKIDLEAENATLKDSVLAKNSMTTAGVGSGSVRPNVNEVKLSPAETTLFNRTNARRQARGATQLTVEQFVTGAN